MSQIQVHTNTIKNFEQICSWYKQKAAAVPYPIYSSYDIRDAGYKVTNVDANIYPAGFNNICPTDKETTVHLFEGFIHFHYGEHIKKILLVSEEHTNNPYYWDNVHSIKTMLMDSGFQVEVAIPREMSEPLKLKSYTGHEVIVGSALQNSPLMTEFKPDLIISNNDFSESYEEWSKTVRLPMNPPRELGWYQRKKSRYFKNYNQLATEFAEVAGLDPFLLRVETEVFENFDINDESSRNVLANHVDAMIVKLRAEYAKRGIQQQPFVFVKNNSGTYGLAVIKVNSGDEVRAWSYKSRKKMKAAKGGKDVEEVIVQEGIPSIVQADGASAEPVIYMVGCELAGGFLRTHSEKTSTESLNSPGAVYKRLCVSDLQLKPEGCPEENVYGWVAKLGLLAIAYEAKEMGVDFKDYKVGFPGT